MVERRNQIIARVLFKECKHKRFNSEAFYRMVEFLPEVIKQMNKKTKREPPKRPKDTDPVCEGDSCNLLEIGTKVRVQLEQPIDVTTGKRNN